MAVLLEDLTWQQAEQVLSPYAIVVIPLGAAAKEHGPHLRLKNDFLLAEYFKSQILSEPDVVILPTVAYHFYPAFVEYPGSISLSLETARDLIVDICKSVAAFGPRKFYVLNTGVSTVRALKPAAEVLSGQGVRMAYTDLLAIMEPVERKVAQQQGGTHADELETSMMLYIAPDSVDMSKAVCDYREGEGRLTRNPDGPGIYSPSGVWGDATLATREKGEVLVTALAKGVAADIAALRNCFD